MNIKIYPSESKGSINGVSSKSFAHRFLIAAALSSGVSTLDNVILNDDILRTIEGLKVLGAQFVIFDHTIRIHGIDLKKRHEHVVINAHESGSTLRFLIPLASHLSASTTFMGSETLLKRPLSVYEKLYKEHDIQFEMIDQHLHLGSFPQQTAYRISGAVSSQFISGLLFVMPLLQESSDLIIVDHIASKPYVDLTLSIMEKFGLTVIEKDNTYYVEKNQSYKPIHEYCENDFSQAAFFAILGAINHEVSLSGLSLQSKQGDKQFISDLQHLGVNIEIDELITIFKSSIKSGTIDLEATPDLGPIYFVLALFSEEQIVFTNTKRLAIKESNRVEAMRIELEKIGATMIVSDNQVIVKRLEHPIYTECFNTHNDHRIAMALSILATTLPWPTIINNADCVNKSYPDFFKHLRSLNIHLEEL